MKAKDFKKIIKSRSGKKSTQTQKKQASAFHLKFAQAFFHSFAKSVDGVETREDFVKKYTKEPTQEQIEQFSKSMAIMQPGQLYPTKLQKRLHRNKAKWMRALKKYQNR